MNGPEYAWFTIFLLNDKWWDRAIQKYNVSCSLDQIVDTMNGYFTFGGNPFTTSANTVSRLVNSY